MRASERAQWQGKIADALEQFETGGIDQTHDEMVNRLNEQTAKNEARMELALDSIDTETMEIEANAEKLRAHELVEQFKAEMGKVDSPEKEKSVGSSDGKKEIEMDDQTSEKQQDKTIGNKERSKS